MEFRTEVKIASPQCIQLKDPILLIGSCFSENIGNKLLDLKLDVLINPFGILYQPSPIANALDRIIARKHYDLNDLIEHEGLFHSPDHHGIFSSTDASETLLKINDQIDATYLHLKKENLVMLITWGTAIGFRAKSTGKLVGNCHKIPAVNFESYLDAPQEIEYSYLTLIEKLRYINPTIKIVFSVSPVRHKRDGFIANQHSKSVLFVALHQLLQKDKVLYFPAYEIVMDELRDYRFFANDMLHPSELAVTYIWDKFTSHYLDKPAQQAIKEIENINKLLTHRPIHQNRTAHLDFLRNTEKQVLGLMDKYPFLDYRSELESFKNKSNNFETHD